MDFNEIKNTWKKAHKDKHLNAAQIEMRLTIAKKSTSTIDKIKRNSKVGIIALIVVYLIFLAGAFVFLYTPIGIAIITIITILAGIGLFYAIKSYRRIKNTLVTDDTIVPALIKIIKEMERSLRFGMGNLYKFILIPVALLAGIAIGIYIGAGEKSYIETIYALEPKSIIKIILVIVIGSSITIPYSQHIMKKMYKQHLDELKQCLKGFDETVNIEQ